MKHEIDAGITAEKIPASSANIVVSADYPYGLAMAEDEIDLRELFLVIWRGKWLVVAITFICALGALAFALYQPNIYKSEVLLAPAEGQEKGGLSGLAGQFGGLASLAGISLGSSGVDKTTLALEVLKSRAFITDFIKRHDLLVPLMAAKGWDLNEGRWLLDEETYDSATETWVREVKPPKSAVPSDLEVYEVFKEEILNVSQDKQTSMVKLAIESLSPKAAQQWASWLVEDLNRKMRQLDVTEANTSIDYLKQQIEKTPNAGMQQVFYQLIEEQTKMAMLAEVRDEYVFKVVDPAVTPEKKAKPKRATIVAIGIVFGGLLGVVTVMIRHSMRKRT